MGGMGMASKGNMMGARGTTSSIQTRRPNNQSYSLASPSIQSDKTAGLADDFLTQKLQYVQGRTFYWNENQWVDHEIQKLVDPRRIRIAFNSAEYFDLIQRRPQVLPWLALGQNVQFILDGVVYEIFEKPSSR